MKTLLLIPVLILSMSQFSYSQQNDTTIQSGSALTKDTLDSADSTTGEKKPIIGWGKTIESVLLGEDEWMTKDLVFNKTNLHSRNEPYYMPAGWHLPTVKQVKALKKVAKNNGWKLSEYLVGGKSGLNLEENYYYWAKDSSGSYNLLKFGEVYETIYGFFMFYISENTLIVNPKREDAKLRMRCVKDKP